MTRANKSHLDRVASLDCVLCGRSGPSTVHHIREGQGMGQRADDFLTVALCPECHQGPHGVHGDRALLRIQKVEEMDLLVRTLRRLLA